LVFATQSPYSGCKNFLIAAQAASKQPERYAPLNTHEKNRTNSGTTAS
jgi:hypothetical protein